MVDGNFAANARVDLCKKARRQLNEWNAAHIGCSHKTREITNHAAAQGKDRRLPVEAEFDRTRKETIRFVQRLRTLPRGNHNDLRRDARRGDALRDALGIERTHVRICDEHAARRISCAADECDQSLR